MKTFLLCGLLPLLTLATLPHTALAQPGSDTFPPTVEAGPTQLVKVGEGTFRWMFIRVYNGSFYMDGAQRQADPLSDVAKRLELAYRIGISAEDFRKSGNEILTRNCAPEELAALQERLDRLNAAYQPVAAGDRYALTYVPGEGTTLSLNGNPLVTVEGADFAKAYFSIWLGQDPVKEDFRQDLLGY